MRFFANPAQAGHCPEFEFFRGRRVPCHETPERFQFVAEVLGSAGCQLESPDLFPDEALHAVHTPRYLAFLKGAWAEWLATGNEGDAFPAVWPGAGMRRDRLPENFAARMGFFSFDTGTPLAAGSWEAARTGADCALSAAQSVLGGERSAFVLTRPPGHHAGIETFGGYCFLNNAALAAQALREGGASRVAILDVDYHHGNGSQEIFYTRPDVFFASIHGDPMTEYPFYLGHADERGEGAGLGANLNLPLPAGAPAADWFSALEQALTAIAQCGAEALVVSLGVDAWEGDPISRFRLKTSDYGRLGERLRQLGLPAVFVLEGGYAVRAIGDNVLSCLRGFDPA